VIGGPNAAGLLELAVNDNNYGNTFPEAGDANGGAFSAAVTIGVAGPASVAGVSSNTASILEGFNTTDFTFVRASASFASEVNGYSLNFYANAAACGAGVLIGQVNGLTANSSAVYRLPLQAAGTQIQVVAVPQGDALPSVSNCYVMTPLAAQYDAETGHFYEYVPIPGQPWTTANKDAGARVVLGAPGHLATIGDASENAFVETAAGGGFRAWIGLTFNSQTGVFGWVDNTPGGSDFAENWYHNWAPGEPNHAGELEFFVEMFGDGSWNDNQDRDPVFPTSGYMVEYEPPIVIVSR
jgi:hypothetical protein